MHTRRLAASLSVVLLLLIAGRLAAQEADKGVGVRPRDQPEIVSLRYRSQWALLVGIDRYPQLPPQHQLQFAKADVKALAQLLTTEYGYRPEHIVTLLDAQATRSAVLDALSDLADNTRVQKADSVLIYFSGHGKDLKVDRGIMGFLIPHDARVDLERLDNPAPFLKTCVSMDELNKTARLIPARHVLFLIDSCYSGLAAEQPRDFRTPEKIDLSYLRGLLNFEVRQIITAGSSGEQVVENPTWGHSAFCYKMLEALRDGALDRDADGVILASELGAHLQKAVPGIARQTPQAKVLSGEGGFVFFRARPAAAQPSSRPSAQVPELAASLRQGDQQRINRLVAQGDYEAAMGALEAYERDHGADGFVSALKPKLTARLRPQPVRPPADRPVAVGTELPPTLTLNCGNGVTMELVRIPAGIFMMGSPDSEAQRNGDEGPQHRVTISRPLYMGKFEVTQAQWQAVMGSNPSYFKGDDNLPVEQVSWNDCVEFCRKLSSKTGRTVRLPSEAAWEYACRAGTTTPFHFGQTISTDQANYDGNYTYGNGVKGAYRQKTTPVGSFPANAWGLHDMHGNVWEWCEDVYHDRYAGAPTDGSAWTSGGDQGIRVLRGGCWYYYPWLCRSAVRLRLWTDNRLSISGLRVVVVFSGTP